MRRVSAVIAALFLAVFGSGAAPASATIGDGPTQGSYTTNQSCTASNGTHNFSYDYTVSNYSASQVKFTLTEARYSGPGTTGLTYKAWAPQVSTSGNASTTTTSSSGFASASGKGLYQSIASSLPSGSTTITAGTPAASGWGYVLVSHSNNPATNIHNGLLKSWIGSGSYPYSCTSSNFDLGSNVPPAPPKDISGSFSMDFHCYDATNNAYESFWTWYYTVSGTNPNWTLTTTGLAKNFETAGALTDLEFGSNHHIVNGDVIPFTWASGNPPNAYLIADWGGSPATFCSVGPKDLTANF
jgi:hypothetical protein